MSIMKRIMLIMGVMLSVKASATVDIGLFQINDSTLQVRLLPQQNFSGIVSNIAFTVRWNASDGATLGPIVPLVSQLYPELVYIPMSKSGGEQDDSGFRYQIYAGFGSQPMANFGASWTAGNEVVLMNIDINGCSDFAIVNDSWTGDITNNGDFFVALAGLNETGNINTSTVSNCSVGPCSDVTVNQSESICEGDSIFVGAAFQTTSGVYNDTFTLGNGCDSITSTSLTVLPVSSSAQNITICGGESYFVGGGIQTTTGVYTDTLAGATGCDSVVITNLTVLPAAFTAVDTMLCSTDSVFAGGAFQNVSGSYYDTLVAANSCDSIIETNVTVTGCGDVVDIGLFSINDSTLQVRLLPHLDFGGIVSNIAFTVRWDASDGANLGPIVPLVSQVYPELVYIPMSKSGGEQDDSGFRYQIYAGFGSQPMANFGAGWTDGNEVVLMNIGVNGCSDFAIVNDSWTGDISNNGDFFVALAGINRTGTINTSSVSNCAPPDTCTNVTVNQSETICEGDSLFVGGGFQATSGTYNDIFALVNGCDSIVTTDLTVLPDAIANLSEAICEGDSLFVGGSFQSTAGTFTDTLQAANGCDSIVITELSVLTAAIVNASEAICEGDSLFVGGAFQSASGIYTDTLMAANGCDSIVLTELSVLSAIVVNESEEICSGDSLFVGGAFQTATGTYTDTFQSSIGCDSIRITALTVLSSIIANMSETICDGDSLFAGGVFQTTSGTYNDTFVASGGCDSIVVTELTVQSETTVNNSETICDGDSLFVGGAFQTISGNYTDTFSSSGCDSIVITNLSVLANSSSSADVTICQGESFLAGGANQTTSGVYTDTFQAANSCDSVVITNLTVLPGSFTFIDTMLCNTDSIFAGGAFQNTSGVYTDIFQAANGCDSIVETTVTVMTCGDVVDIGLFLASDSVLEVRLLPRFDFDGIVSNVQFSIRWDAASGASLGNINQVLFEQVYIPMQKSGNETDDSGFRYQVFFGSGSLPMSTFPGVSWTAGTEVTLLTIPVVNGCSDSFQIINDAWTGGVTTNGDYFVSLAGIDATGMIYTSTVSTCDAICSDVFVNQNEVVCQGDSLFVGGAFQTTAGIYTDTFVIAGNCDSIVVTELSILPAIIGSANDTICEGDSVFVGGAFQTEAGSYADTLQAANGCDSIVLTDLFVLSAIVVNESEAICQGDSIFLEGDFQTAAGVYRDTITVSASCDSIIITQLTVVTNIIVIENETICEGDSLFVGGAFQTLADIYTDTLQAANGCDSIVVTNLSLLPAIVVNVTDTICDGESLFVGGGFQTTAGIYSDTLQAVNGCDSIVTTELSVRSGIILNESVAICTGDSLFVGGAFQTTAGIYSDTVQVANGCDTIILTELAVASEILINQLETICDGDSLLAGGSFQTTAGIYTDTFTALAGCDSIVVTNLNVLPNVVSNVNDTICDWESVFVGGSFQTTAGTYTDTLATVNGCDSIVITELSVLPTVIFNTSEAICEGDSILVGGAFQTTTGIYNDTFAISGGCDSIVTTQLTVLPNEVVGISDTICEGDSLFVGGAFQTLAGTYSDTLLTVNGCDSIIITELSVLSGIVVNQSVMICTGDSLFVGGSFQTTSGIYTDTLEVTDGCDSITITDLSVVSEIEINESAAICEGDSFFVGGAFQIAPGIYRDTFTASGGCDSIIITALTVFQNFAITIDTTICDGESYFAGGKSQVNSGMYFDTLTTVSGCDSIIITNLNVLPTFEITVDTSICAGESYFAGGANQTITGTYTDTFSAMNSCDSLVITNLTVLTNVSATIDTSICEGDSLFAGGSLQLQTGTFQDTFQSVSGCDSIVTTNLTILPTPDTTFSITICEGEVYPIGGVNQGQAGIYFDTLSAANGCDSILIFDLAVITDLDCDDGNPCTEDMCDNGVCRNRPLDPGVIVNVSAAICEGDSLFVGGAFQTTAGTYTDTLQMVTGCDSVVITELSVATTILTNVSEVICDGDSLLVGGSFQTTSGIYEDTLTASGGCDSIVVTELTVLSAVTVSASDSICAGDSLFVGGSFQTTSGTYLDTLQTVNGCDSIVITELSVVPALVTNLSETICEGDRLFAGGSFQTTTGIYTDTFSAAAGCDSIVITDLTVEPAETVNVSVSVCTGDSLFAGGSFQTTTGTYTDTFQTARGCDSIIITELSVVASIIINESEAICDGDSLFAEGDFQTTSGIYTDTFTASGGCDSIIVTELTVLSDIIISASDSICTGDSLFVGGEFQSTAGTYTDTLQAASGCDSIVITELTVLPDVLVNESDTICEGDSLLLGGSFQTTAGLYFDTLSASSGCDSIVATTLTVLPVSATILTTSVCEGTSIEVGNSTYNSTGVYIDTLTAANGCDSVITTTLTVLPNSINTVNENICDGDSLFAGGDFQTQTNTYFDTLTAAAANGCDSIVITNLTVLPNSVFTVDTSICEGESYFAGGTDQTTTGTYFDTLVAANGCDSLVSTNLQVLPVARTSLSTSFCEGGSVTVGNSTYNTTGVYFDTLPAANGCDSIITTTLTVSPTVVTNVDTVICEGESYFAGGANQTLGGVYLDTLPAANSCDSIIITSLTVLSNSTFTIDTSICNGESYLAGGANQTTSGNYFDTLPSANGCDSIVVTNLTVLPNSIFTVDTNICSGESYLAGGANQTTTGNYFDTLTAANGCDSVVVTNLTVLSNSTFTVDTVICDGESYFAGGADQTTTGTYFDTLVAANGCDSIVNTNLQVLPVANTSLSTSFCDGGSVTVGNSTYDTTGVYFDTLTAANGCDSIITTTLTVFPTVVTTIDTAICDGETYFAGEADQTQSGVYFDTLASLNSCDSVIITTLTVLPNSIFTIDTSICNGESYLAGGTNQTTSGNYFDTLTAANGCDSVVITNLTVLPNITFTIDTGICEGESYFAGGANQTTTGVYFDTLPAANGCDSIILTDLEVFPVSRVTLTTSFCEGDSITVGSSTYDSTGTFLDTLTAANGCDSIITTVLTVSPTLRTTVDTTICSGRSYFAGGASQTQNGTYFDTFTTTTCDSVVTTILTINDCDDGNSCTIDSCANGQCFYLCETVPPTWNLNCQNTITHSTSNGAVCPSGAAYSLNVGDEITVFDTWTVGGITTLPLSGCVSDNCTDEGSLIIRVTAITDDNAGPCQQTLTITFEAEDSCGNKAGGFTCTDIFIDNTLPQINGVGLNDTIQCTDAVTFSSPTATDNCGVPALTFEDDTTTTSCDMTITRTWTAIDSCNNAVSASQSIIISDTTAPVWDFACQDTVTHLTSTGAECPEAASYSLNVGDEITALDSWTVGGIPSQALSSCINDNCTDIGVLILRVTAITDDDADPCQQTLTITFEAEDACGNIAGGFTHTDIFIDDSAPSIVGIGANDTVQCNSPLSFSNPTANDNCDSNPTLTFEDDTVTVGCTYTITRTWTATDSCNNTAMDSQSVTITDTVAPVWNFGCQLTNTYTTAIDGAECPADATLSLNIGDEFTTSDLWTVGGITIFPLAGCLSDNCTNTDSLIIRVVDITDDNAGPCQQTITLVLVAEDACGNISEEFTDTYIFIDDTDPGISGVGADDTIQCTEQPVFSNPTATDNCDLSPALAFEDDTVTLSCGYIITRTWTATDTCNNTATAAQSITVTDTLAPVWDFSCATSTTITSSGDSADCPVDAVFSLNVGDEISVLDSWTVAGVVVDSLNGCVSDNCTEDSTLIIRVTAITDDNAGPCQQTLTITFEAEDNCGNKAGNFTRTYLIVDDSPPLIEGVGNDTTIQCDQPIIFTTPTVTDNCDPAPSLTFEDDTLPGACPNSYTITRLWTARDTCNNRMKSSQRIVVIDTIAPEWISACELINTYTTSNGADCPSSAAYSLSVGDEISVFDSWTVGGMTSNPISSGCVSDNCSEDSTLIIRVVAITDDDAGPCQQILTITFVAQDECGNVSSTFTCTDIFIDDTPPAINGVEANDTIRCSEVVVFSTPTTSDNCSSPSFSFADDTIFSGLTYAITRTWTAIDACDSITTASQSITVLPNSATVIDTSICDGDGYFAGGTDQTLPGTYYDTLVAANGCDSIVTTNLTVLPNSSTIMDVSICEGETFLAAGTDQTQSGTYFDTLIAANGCDSVITTNLTVLPNASTTIDVVICEGEIYLAGGECQQQTGTYFDTLLAANGCDSVVTTNVTVLPNALTVTTVAICAGESILVGGADQDQPGSYFDTLSAANGCDSIVITVVEFLNCNDGNPCTIDTCLNGQCINVERDCNDNNPCTDDYCDGITGACVNVAKNCDDGDPCTIDYCDTGGQCAHDPLLTIESLTLINAFTDQDIREMEPYDTITICDGRGIPMNIRANTCPDTVGSVVFNINGVADSVESIWQYAIGGNYGNNYLPWYIEPGDYVIIVTPYSGAGGGGTAGTPATCVLTVLNGCDDGDPCTIDECDPITGDCIHTAVVCDDGNPCTIDACDPATGGCVFTPKDCDDGDPCTIDGCNPANGQCTYEPVLTIESLTLVDAGSDQDIRELDDEDSIYVCSGSTYSIRADVCPDSVGSVKFLVNGIARPIENILPYVIPGDLNGNYQPWSVQPGVYNIQAIPYSKRGAGGTVGTGKAITLVVIAQCDDGNPCTIDSCDLTTGQCISTAKDCSDGNPCTIDDCDPVTGACIHEPVVCDDGNPCTDDICDGLTGQCYFIPSNCDDGDPCTIDACNPNSGQCTHTPLLTVESLTLINADTDQDIKDLNTIDTIQICSGNSFSIRANICPDTVGSVKFMINGVSQPIENVIPYAIAGDWNGTNYLPWNIQPGIYKITVVPYGNAGGGGTVGTSKTITLIVIAQCDDGDLCTTDNCDLTTGQCIFTPKNCDDGNPCTVDNCDPNTGACINALLNCDDGDPCTDDVCNSATGTCNSIPKNCDDGDPCTIDYCDNGQCVHDPALTVDGFVLVNASTEADIGPISSGDIISRCELPHFNIRADLCPDTIGSVQILVNGQPTRVEEYVPYSLGGDNPLGEYHSWNIAPGTYDLTVIPYSGDNRTGTMGSPVTITITIVNDCDDGDPCTIDVCDHGSCIHTPEFSQPDYLRVVNTQKSWKKLKLGYSATSLWTPKQNVIAGGNDTLCVTLRDTVGNAQWDKIQIRPQGNATNPATIADYMPAGGIGSSWTKVYIPLSVFQAIDLTQLTMISVPYSNGADAFDIHIQRIEFIGGATPFLWFGEPKTDNAHDGGTVGGSALFAELIDGAPCSGQGLKMSEEDNNEGTVKGSFGDAYYVHAYPNPFKDKLTLEFSFDMDQWAKLEIYTPTGERVAQLFNGMAESGVLYKVEFFVENNAGGMYIYRLQTAEGTYTDKLVLVR